MNDKKVIRKIFLQLSGELIKLTFVNSKRKITPKVGIASIKANFEAAVLE